MLSLWPLSDRLVLKGLDVLDPTAEVTLELRIDGWRDELELGF